MYLSRSQARHQRPQASWMACFCSSVYLPFGSENPGSPTTGPSQFIEPAPGTLTVPPEVLSGSDSVVSGAVGSGAVSGSVGSVMGSLPPRLELLEPAPVSCCSISCSVMI